MRANLLFYDIPQCLKIANPSNRLRRVAVRCNLSCWIVPEDKTPFDIIDELKSKGCSVELVRFDENEEPKLRRLAREAMEKETGRIVKGLAKSIALAQKQLADALDNLGEIGEKKLGHEYLEANNLSGFDEAREKIITKHDAAMRAILNRAKKDCVAAEECSICFDLLADVGELVRGTRHAIKVQHDVFYAMLAKRDSAEAVAHAS
jgi:hypothetical protein